MKTKSIIHPHPDLGCYKQLFIPFCPSAQILHMQSSLKPTMVFTKCNFLENQDLTEFITAEVGMKPFCTKPDTQVNQSDLLFWL